MFSKVTHNIKKFFKGKGSLLVVMVAAIFSLSGRSADAKTYTATVAGQFNSNLVWSPEYPGNVIEEGDTVIIGSNIDLNVDVIVKGAMILKDKSRMSGEKFLVVLDNGMVVNSGMTLVKGITNRGFIYNKHIMETSQDLINTGKIYNNSSMVVGNILDNVGIISGNGGHLIANNRFVNSQTGSIVGNIDICSANFMNVNGGRIDSTYMSFCGNRIFSEVFLTASIKKENVVLSLLNSENKVYDSYKIERSSDGTNYEVVATLKGSDVEDPSVAFRYTDNHIVTDGKVFYRMTVTTAQGEEDVLPAVQVGSIIAGRQ